jgi:pre-60S factor REI1
MRTQHSFYILDIDFVMNLKGLLSYIAERIHLGYLCLFCKRMFKNSRRCQQHMVDKAHCFMNPNDELEYAPFYNFASYYQQEQPTLVPHE